MRGRRGSRQKRTPYVPFFRRFRNRRQFHMLRAAMAASQADLRRRSVNGQGGGEQDPPRALCHMFYLPPRMPRQIAVATTRGNNQEPLVEESYSRKTLLLQSRGMRHSAAIVEHVRSSLFEDKEDGMFHVIPDYLFYQVRSDVAVGEEDYESRLTAALRETGTQGIHATARIPFRAAPSRRRRRRRSAQHAANVRGGAMRQRQATAADREMPRNMADDLFLWAETAEDHSPPRQPEGVVSGSPRCC